MTDTPIHLVGNIVAEPEVRFTPAGAAVCNFRMASTPRKFNKNTNEWEDGEALFLTVNVWRDQAQNIAASLQKGMRVLVIGNLKSRSYETREGEKRTVIEVEADEVGPSLKYATAVVTKSQGGGGQSAPARQPAAVGGGNDPWGSQPADFSPPF